MLAYALGEIVLLLLGRDLPSLRRALMLAYKPGRFAITSCLFSSSFSLVLFLSP